jgi:hypothetical protein
MHIMAGFEPSGLGTYHLPRAKILPPTLLIQVVWPWVNIWLNWFKLHNKKGKEKEGEKKGRKGKDKNRDKNQNNLVAQGFLQLLD